MGYIASSFARNYSAVDGQNMTVTLPLAGLVGDVYAALATAGDNGNVGIVTSVSSGNISWQLAKAIPHQANTQDAEVWIGRVHTAFSANTEVVTMNTSAVDAYREVACAGYRAETGFAFNASTYFENAQSVTYNADNNPTGTDGFSCTPVLSGNGKHLLLGVAFFENSSGTLANVSPGTNYSQDNEWGIFDIPAVDGLFESRTYDGSTDQAVTATYNINATYMTSLVGIALLQSPGGVPPHARPYSPDAAGMRTGLRM